MLKRLSHTRWLLLRELVFLTLPVYACASRACQCQHRKQRKKKNSCHYHWLTIINSAANRVYYNNQYVMITINVSPLSRTRAEKDYGNHNHNIDHSKPAPCHLILYFYCDFIWSKLNTQNENRTSSSPDCLVFFFWNAIAWFMLQVILYLFRVPSDNSVGNVSIRIYSAFLASPYFMALMAVSSAMRCALVRQFLNANVERKEDCI